jgi:hypothetical protein
VSDTTVALLLVAGPLVGLLVIFFLEWLTDGV